MTPRTPTPTLIAALRTLAAEIQSPDGVANAAIAEAADRLEEMEHTWLAKEVDRRRVEMSRMRRERQSLVKEVNKRRSEMSRMRRERQSLINWIREQGKASDTCTYNVLREVCENCRCHRSNGEKFQ